MDLTNSRHVLAGTAWGENRSHGAQGMQSVLNVVMNRAANPRWWGRTPLAVCLYPKQFSCWNLGDPNRAQIMAVNSSDPDFQVALTLAWNALNGTLPDITGGADSYYDLSMSEPPEWARGATRTCVIGGQAFYRVELPPPAAAASVAAPAADSADTLNQAELDALEGEA